MLNGPRSTIGRIGTGPAQGDLLFGSGGYFPVKHVTDFTLDLDPILIKLLKKALTVRAFDDQLHADLPATR